MSDRDFYKIIAQGGIAAQPTWEGAIEIDFDDPPEPHDFPYIECIRTAVLRWLMMNRIASNTRILRIDNLKAGMFYAKIEPPKGFPYNFLVIRGGGEEPYLVDEGLIRNVTL